MTKYLKIIIKYRWIYFLSFFIPVSIALILFFTLPRRYTATAEIMPSLEPETMATIGASLTLANPFLNLMVTPADIYARILRSRTVVEGVIDKLDLQRRFKARYKDVLIRKLQKSIGIKVYPEGLIEVYYEHKDKVLATRIVNEFILVADSVNRYAVMTKGKELRIFLEGRLKEMRLELSAYQDSLGELQKKYGFIDLPEEYKAFAHSFVNVYTDLVLEKARLEYIANLYGKDSPLVEKKEKQIRALKDYINKKILKGQNISEEGYGVGFSVSLNKLPEVLKKYLMYNAEIEARKEAYSFLFSKYEEAKLLEKKDTPTINILSFAKIPQKKSWPRGSRLVFLGIVVGFIVSFLYTIYAEKEQVKEIIDLLIESFDKDLSVFRKRR
ncbi:MAG: hypothetical protein DRP08_02135 [Candidatus Aenigmatarchaeota archaeon]|nr:MAG: hypothetical protein DRP08_02135 [Candidatus Aenigmarchaeota archaeon]